MVFLVFNILIGLVVLLAGRQLFWFFVGAVGFLVGLQFTTRFTDLQPAWLAFLIAIIVGLVGALLAVLLQRVAIGIAGFLAGASATSFLIQALAPSLSRGVELMLLVIAGIIAAVLVMVMFDWALIFLSSLAGTTLIVRGLALNPLPSSLIFLGLFLLGFIVQAAVLLRQETPPPSPIEESSQT